jgi:hypothetical protein
VSPTLPATIQTTAYDFAEKFIGIHEIAGDQDHPLIQFALSLCFAGKLHMHDEVPNCSAWMNLIAWLLKLPMSHSAAARSWLAVGTPVPLEDAIPGNDVIILSRGGGDQPGPEVLEAPGHVGLFGWRGGDLVTIRGGNQGDEFNDRQFNASRVLGVRRLNG